MGKGGRTPQRVPVGNLKPATGIHPTSNLKREQRVNRRESPSEQKGQRGGGKWDKKEHFKEAIQRGKVWWG